MTEESYREHHELPRPWKFCILKNREVVPVSAVRWGLWFETTDRRVAEDFVQTARGTLRVSTVFLGLDHGFGDKPLYFETMVFDTASGSGLDYWTDKLCQRYETWDEAEQGHREVVDWLTAGGPLEVDEENTGR